MATIAEAPRVVRPRRQRRVHWQIHIYQVLAVVAALALWQFISGVGIVSTTALPAPTTVLPEAVRLASDGTFWSALGDTAYSWAAALAIAIVASIPLGSAIGAVSLVDRSTRLVIDFLRSIPTIAILPLGLLLLGARPKLEIILVATACLWPMTLQVAQGIRDIEPVALDTARSYRFSRWQRFKWVVVPSIGTYFATGVRLTSVLGLFSALGIELLGGIPGLGYQMYNSLENGDGTRLVSYVVWTTVLVVIVNLILAALEGRALRWHSSRRGQIA